MTSADCSSCQRLRANNCALCCSTFLLPLLLLLLLQCICVGFVMAAPQTSCILCDKEDVRARVPVLSANSEEFVFEHQVSRQEAIQALRKYNETHGTQNACNTIQCTSTLLKYCLGAQFLNDHCWCDLKHREEGLPYVPHICYAGEKVHKPSVGSCFAFEEVKECCCAPALVKEWRHISGASSTLPIPKIGLAALVSAWSLLHWRSNC